MDGCILEIKSFSEGITLNKGKSAVDTTLGRGFTTEEVKVAKESA